MLVVEDHPKLARSLAEGLREEGFAVDLTFDGAEAASLVAINEYDQLKRINRIQSKTFTKQHHILVKCLGSDFKIQLLDNRVLQTGDYLFNRKRFIFHY